MKPRMRPLWLDYQRPAASANRWPGIALLAVGAFAGVLVFEQSSSLSAELESAEEQVARLQRAAELRRQQGGGAGDAAEARPPSPSAARWDGLFTALERAGDDSVTLLGLDPGAREIAIAGEARDVGAALDYVQRLQAATVLADAHLARHEVVADQPARPVRFTVVARWREGAP